MEIKEIIIEAINTRKPIQFEYNRNDKIRGERIGNPHILFINPETNKIMAHIFQTSGVSDSGLSDGLPWRLFFIEFIENIKILHNESSFSIAEGYNPESPMYINVIAKV